MGKKNILVFPCGSEVALEIHRSVEYSSHFNLMGGNSIDDHGKYIFQKYISDLPFVNDKNFIREIKKVVIEHNIDAIYPAMDSVITELKKNEKELGCKIISSEINTTEICLSKKKTYRKLNGIVPIPLLYASVDDIRAYPVFIKPDVGYGSRGVYKAVNKEGAEFHLLNNPNSIISQYLPGKEYTIDCFTNFRRELLFVGQRERKRIMNGISVNTSTMKTSTDIIEMAESINAAIAFNGAWFFQVKEGLHGELVLMEIASRIAGSSAVYRAKGINFSLLSLYNAFELPVEIMVNGYEVELDRALSNKYILNIDFSCVYIDFDDTIIIDGKVNTRLIVAIYHFINRGKKVILITKHEFPIHETLRRFKLDNLFDEIIHLKKYDEKCENMITRDAIFIDDSFGERKKVKEFTGMPVFSVDMIEALI